ncbi:MAG: GyrI-like domain-containing protein [Caldilineaceae bacterium]|nr:GyrI-like domain-containing protein [Caldilineaceae bacterium]HRJ41770.1 GyrI-like domain-containing protein [Caldilineaceae bacterium]
MQPQIVNKPPFTVVGMQIRTQPMSPAIPQLWDRFAPRIDEIGSIVEPHVSYGVMGHYDEKMGFDYMAGVAADQSGDLPGGMCTWDVPAYTYAVFEATLPTLGEVFGKIYNGWLAEAGYQPLPDLCFERYGETFNPEDPNSKLSVYIPVEKKA